MLPRTARNLSADRPRVPGGPLPGLPPDAAARPRVLVGRAGALGADALRRRADGGPAPGGLSDARTEVFVRAQLRGSDPALVADFTRSITGMMVVKDGPEHHRLRVLGNHAFTPSAAAARRAVIERVVDDLLDAALPRGRLDLIDDLARPLPAIVIADLFGIPPEDREMFHHWSMASARFFGGAVGDLEEAARAANEAVRQLGACPEMGSL